MEAGAQSLRSRHLLRMWDVLRRHCGLQHDDSWPALLTCRGMTYLTLNRNPKRLPYYRGGRRHNRNLLKQFPRLGVYSPHSSAGGVELALFSCRGR
jgi:hypothetical protein